MPYVSFPAEEFFLLSPSGSALLTGAVLAATTTLSARIPSQFSRAPAKELEALCRSAQAALEPPSAANGCSQEPCGVGNSTA